MLSGRLPPRHQQRCDYHTRHGSFFTSGELAGQAKARAKVDPHSPERYRVNGLVVNMPEFARAFACPADAPLAKKEPCRVW